VTDRRYDRDAAGCDIRAVGRTFRRLREAKAFSVEQLADLAATTPDRVEAVEDGRDPLRYDLFCGLADALGIQPSEVIRRARGGS
jgi:transcriptional regulator with XRE-family HTH domain